MTSPTVLINIILKMMYVIGYTLDELELET